MINFRKQIFRILQIFAVSFFLLAPIIKTSNGNALIGFNVNNFDLYFFNNVITFDSFFVTSLVIIIIVFLFILITQIFGRLWCGWLCPQSVFTKLIFDITSKINKNIKFILKMIFALLFSIILSTNWVLYFMPIGELYNSITTSFGSVSSIIWLVLVVTFFLDFAFVGFLWCRYLCPYAKMQTLMTDNGTLYVGLLKGKEDDCIDCKACVKNCPVKIDPRKTPDNACVYCETCINTCTKVLGKKNKPSVLGYNWGIENIFTFKRINLLITLSVTLLLVLLLFYNIYENKPLSIEYNNYLENNTLNISMKNGTTKNIIVKFNGYNNVEVEPKSISLRAKEKKNFILKINSSNNDEIKIEAITNNGYINIINLKKKN